MTGDHVPAVVSFRTLRWLARRGVSRRRLRGSFVHRVLGERLFTRSVWRFERDSVARGWLVGAIAGSIPLVGLQLFLGVPAALVCRANLFVVVALVCATNPLTAALYYPFCFAVGCLLLGRAVADFHWDHWRDLSFLEVGLPLVVGTLAVGGTIGAIGFGATRLLWRPRKSGPWAAG